MKLIATIAGVDVIQTPKIVYWLSDEMIDGDGSGGNKEKDPDFQAQTTLRNADGTSLNSRTVPFGVVPRQVRRGATGIVMGCLGLAIHTGTKKSSYFVVADEGPSDKIGEGSIALADSLGAPDSPTTGGDDVPEILWIIWPDEPATIDGVTYKLQRA